MKKFKQYLPVIFTVGSIIGVIGSNVITAHQAPKACQKIKDTEESMMYDKGRALTKLERFKIAAPYYIPSCASIAATVGCILAGSKYSDKIASHALAAQAGTAAVLKKYTDEAKELRVKAYDDDGNEHMFTYDEVIKARIANQLTDILDIEIEDPLKTVRFYDEHSGTMYESTWIEQAMAEETFIDHIASRDYNWRQTVADYYDILRNQNLNFSRRENWEYRHTGWSTAWLWENDQDKFKFIHQECIDEDGTYYEVRFIWPPVKEKELDECE